jgi:hypothetical protein
MSKIPSINKFIELQDLILIDIVKDGKAVTEKAIRKYQTKLNAAFDDMVADAE